MSIRQLIKKWREPGYGAEIKTICANDLEKAMPEWITITDDPDTWPELDHEYDDSVEVVARFPKEDGSMGALEAFDWDHDISLHIRNGEGGMPIYVGGVYRLADDYDAPDAS